MTRVTKCSDCGQREPTRYQRDGVCRECRGITTKSRRRGYVSPDHVEANGEALAYREARNRQRIIQNPINNE
jgi:hypothetical protein